jgi:hypothetical protein
LDIRQVVQQAGDRALERLRQEVERGEFLSEESILDLSSATSPRMSTNLPMPSSSAKPSQPATSVSQDIIQNSVQEASRLSSEDLRVLDDMGL